MDPIGRLFFLGNQGTDASVSFHIDQQKGFLEPTEDIVDFSMP